MKIKFADLGSDDVMQKLVADATHGEGEEVRYQFENEHLAAMLLSVRDTLFRLERNLKQARAEGAV